MPAVDPVELTRDLVRAASVNPPGDETGPAAILARLLTNAGFRVEEFRHGPKRPSLIARRGTASAGKPALGFAGHIDVVPLGKRPWSVAPFGAEIKDGKLYGRGVSDMKAGVACYVAAAINAGAALDKGPGVELVIAAGEETGCEGSLHLAKIGALGHVGALVVAEPTMNAPFIGHKGALWMNAVTRGKTAHGSMPHLGVNAVYKAARAVAKIEDFDFNVKPHPLMGKPTINVGNITGGMNINSVPDETVFGIDVRTIPGMEHAKVHAGLKGYLGPEVEELTPWVDLGGVWTDPENPWVQDVFAVYRPVVGAIEPRTAAFFTDASALTPAYGRVPTLIVGPGETAMAHQTDEYAMVTRIPEATALYIQLIERWQAR